jgi:hypothetical protein
LIALDADAETLAIVAARGMDCVVPMEMSADRLLLRWGGLGRFDLVYSAGLYDYLAAPLAQRLTTCLFEMLTPGGRLLVGNFLPNQPDAGYMETYMGWQLLHRTDAELAALTTDLPSDKVAQARTHSDPFGTIGYLEVRRVS